MHGSLMASNSDPGSTSTSKPVQIIKLVKPVAGHTEKFFASFDGPVKIDFTAIANEQVTYFHDSKTQSLRVVFIDGGQIIIEPFFDSTGVMPNFVFEMAPGQVLDGAEFTSHFPITSTPDVLPALTDGPPGSGAEFNDPSVDSLPLNVANLPSNSTLPPEELPPHELPPIFDAGLPPMLPPPLPPAANNHPPFITAAVDSGTVTEGPLPVMTANGTIDFGDVDLADAHVTSVTPVGSGYLGNFATVVTNDSTGDGVGQVTWLFAANNALRQSLGDGQVLVQTYTVEIADGHGGTATQSVTITIIGTNDAAVISGTASGNVTEAGGVNNGTPGVPTATGDLNSTDVDDPADSWEVINSPTASANGYGTFMIDTAGVWTYTLNNSNAAVEALNAGQTLTDSFTVATIDGTEQVVTITIHGTNDAAVISGDITGTVTEAGGVNNGTPGIPTATGDLNSADVDNRRTTAGRRCRPAPPPMAATRCRRPGRGPTRSTTAIRRCRRSTAPPR